MTRELPVDVLFRRYLPIVLTLSEDRDGGGVDAEVLMPTLSEDLQRDTSVNGKWEAVSDVYEANGSSFKIILTSALTTF